MEGIGSARQSITDALNHQRRGKVPLLYFIEVKAGWRFGDE
jgi:hypothetical protein